MTLRIEEVPVDDPRAVSLRSLLDAELQSRYGPLVAGEPAEITAARDAALAVHPGDVVATLLALDDSDGGDGGEALGHVMLRRLREEWELKRLIVPPEGRRRGIGRALTDAVLQRARAGGARRVILQTGAPQPESVRLYAAAGFTPIPVYEPYVATMSESLCFERML
ncbi:GNAT family N-acetyltransferase [Microbacterium sp. dk485]|uniref:GNAT family N-acetyltransferase n=1 Tax=Microbacterium sp. dk485 TaxID=2560021 RepID=UPI0010731B63|nr:GNAT family N-acetyltransferase [Microbacterium sp. dk485]TFV84954.1 GNAT family N-acetyltransferase [Microbacterium sp. dk485]